MVPLIRLVLAVFLASTVRGSVVLDRWEVSVSGGVEGGQYIVRCLLDDDTGRYTCAANGRGEVGKTLAVVYRTLAQFMLDRSDQVRVERTDLYQQITLVEGSTAVTCRFLSMVGQMEERISRGEYREDPKVPGVLYVPASAPDPGRCWEETQ